MNVGIMIYSETGNTLSVAERLEERLVAAGHTVELRHVTVQGGRSRGDRQFTLADAPDVTPYDGVVFGSSVEAFSLSPVMDAYMKTVGTLDGKTVTCLVTQAFPYRWMGGNRALRQMAKHCRARGGKVAAVGVVNWAKSRREATLRAAIDQLSRTF